MRNLDYVNGAVAKELNLPLEVVEKINKEYWKEVKRKMNDLESTNIFVKKLGTFGVSRYLINKKILKNISMIRNMPKNKKYSELKKQEIIKKIKVRLQKLLYQRNQIALVYYERSTRIPKSTSEGVS